MTPREKVRRLAKGRPVDSGAIVFPLANAVGARIEELDLRAFLTNPTKLTKGLTELNDAIKADAIVCCCAAALEAEGAGAKVSWAVYPPRVTGHLPGHALGDPLIQRVLSSPRIVAAVEATRRLAAMVHGEPALVACLTGPMTLARELVGESFVGAARAGEATAWTTLDFAGRLGVAVAREFLKAGANILLLREEDVLPVPERAAFAEWKSALLPLANVARFHQALPLLMPKVFSPDCDVNAFLGQLPPTVSVCLPEEYWPTAGMHERVAGVAVTGDGNWYRSSYLGKFLVTADEISPDLNIGRVRNACSKLRND